MKSLEDSLLAAAPGDPLFAVWADALVDAGDPRGTLVTLCRQLASRLWFATVSRVCGAIGPKSRKRPAVSRT